MDHIQAVIDDLKDKRAKLDTAISALEELLAPERTSKAASDDVRIVNNPAPASTLRVATNDLPVSSGASPAVIAPPAKPARAAKSGVEKHDKSPTFEVRNAILHHLREARGEGRTAVQITEAVLKAGIKGVHAQLYNVVYAQLGVLKTQGHVSKDESAKTWTIARGAT